MHAVPSSSWPTLKKNRESDVDAAREGKTISQLAREALEQRVAASWTARSSRGGALRLLNPSSRGQVGGTGVDVAVDRHRGDRAGLGDLGHGELAGVVHAWALPMRSPVILGLRPLWRPRARAAMRPAWVRSLISAASYSAIRANMPKTSLPCAVVVSTMPLVSGHRSVNASAALAVWLRRLRRAGGQ